MGDARIDARALDEIELRLRMATPGPWNAPAYRYDPDSLPSYNAVTSEHANICGLHDGGQTRERIDANAHFIANAPTDIASLVAEVRVSASECEKLKAALREFIEWGEAPSGDYSDLMDRARALVGSVPHDEADE